MFFINFISRSIEGSRFRVLIKLLGRFNGFLSGERVLFSIYTVGFAEGDIVEFAAEEIVATTGGAVSEL